MPNLVHDNLSHVLERIRHAAERAGRSAGSVRLVAVSKTVPPETILDAYGSGQRLFGENRAQELTAKAAILPDGIEWHFIGRLQKNKVRAVVRAAEWIHSAESVSLVRRIDRIAGEEGRRPRVLVEVNVSGEASKGGVAPDAAAPVIEAAVQCSNLRLCGLMTIGPLAADTATLGRAFARLRMLRDRMEEEFSVALPELSMGMSGDFEIAIAEGATLVRIGSAIFGPRSGSPPGGDKPSQARPAENTGIGFRH